jgi:DNA replication ATP-dependent helicase Dna2
LLYYSQLDSILRVEAKSNEIRALIIARNELAGWLAKQRTAWAELAPVQPPPAEVADIEDTFLPPTIDHSRECKSCYAVDTCMLYRKVSGSPTGLKPGTHELTLPKTVDRVDATPDDPIAQLYEDKAGHLTERGVACHGRRAGAGSIQVPALDDDREAEGEDRQVSFDGPTTADVLVYI